MPMNKEFYEVLKNADLLDKEKVKLRAALDALIQAKTIVEFKKAIAENPNFTFWQTHYPDLMKNPRLILGGYHMSDDFLKDDGEYNFSKLQQVAAEQRVKLGLQNADEDLLVNILKHNPVQVRAYIGSNAELGMLSNAGNWVASAPAVPPALSENASEAVLSNEAIATIQLEARERLLLKLIASAKYIQIEKFKKLQNALTVDEQKIAAQELGSYVDIGANFKISDTVKTALDKKILSITKQAVTLGYEDHFLNLTDGKVLALHNSKTDKEFTEQLDAPFNTIAGAELVAAKDIINIRVQKYVTEKYEAHIKGLSIDKMIALRNSNDADFKTKLESPFNTLTGLEFDKARKLIKDRYDLVAPAEFLVRAINTDSLANLNAELVNIPAYIGIPPLAEAGIKPLKIKLIKELLAGQPVHALSTIKGIGEAKTVADFNTALNKLAIALVSWIDEPARLEIQKAARLRAFEIQLDTKKASKEQKEAFIAVFKKLDAAGQSDKLTDKKAGKALANALKASDSNALEVDYLGKSAKGVDKADLDKIIEVNKTAAQQHAILTGIHNAPLAKIIHELRLHELKPPVELTPEKIAAINSVFTKKGPPLKIDDLSDAGVYFITNLELILGVNLKSTIESHLRSIKKDGAIEKEFELLLGAIKKDNELKGELLLVYHSEKATVNRKLLDVILSANLGASAVAASAGLPKLDALYENFTESDNKDTFIGKFTPGSPVRQHLKDNLTETRFKEIKEHQNRLNLVSMGFITADFETAQKTLENTLKEIDKIRNSLAGNATALKHLHKITQHQLISPAYQGKAREKSEEMLANYKELDKVCELALDKLRREQVKLEIIIGDLNRLQGGLNNREVTDLFNSAQFKLEALKKDIKYYEDILQKLRGHNREVTLADGSKQIEHVEGVIEVVEKAAAGTTNYVYSPATVTYATMTKDEFLKLESDGTGLPSVSPILAKSREALVEKDSLAAEVSEETDIPEDKGLDGYLLEDSLKAGQIRVYDYKQTLSAGPSATPKLDFVGRFTEEQIRDTSTFPRTRLTVKMFPDAVEDRVEMTFEMALQILSRFDGMPTKELPVKLKGYSKDQVEYMYAALITLGVDSEAIKMNTAVFKPEQHKGTLWGFNKKTFSALGELDKDKHKQVIKESKEKLAGLSDVKADKKGQWKEANKSAIEATTALKKQKAYLDAKEERDEHGSVPVGPKTK